MRRAYAIQLSDFYPSATLPQAIGTLWGYAQLDKTIQENYEMVNVFWENQSVDQVITQIKQPDLLMCSCYVWNWQRTYEIIKWVKKQYPHCLVVIGGPEPGYSIDWITSHPEVDILVPYYGEAIFHDILLEALGRGDYSSVEGVITKEIHSKKQNYPCFEKIPSPFLNGFFDQLLTQKNSSTLYVRCVFESNRGCPYSCSFCDVGSAAYQKIKPFDFERCVQELEWIAKNNIAAVDVADANFGFLARDEELVDHLIEFKKKYAWQGRFLPTWSKAKGERVLRIAKKVIQGGLDSIFGLSLQSLNEETLKNIKRKNAFSLDELSHIVAEMNRDRVCVYTELIFPLPGDTLLNFKQGLYRMLDMDQVFNKFQINQLSRYSNTEMNTPAYQEAFNIEWTQIKGLTRHYYGENASDFIAVANRSISKNDTFEALFFSKSYIIPVYFYGLIRELADDLHKRGEFKRSELVQDIYERLSSQDWFKEFKAGQREHYFSALDRGTHFGQVLGEDQIDFFTEFAVAHQFYLKNDFHRHLLEWYPEFAELIEFDRYSLWQNRSEAKEIEFTKYKKGRWVFSDNREMKPSQFLKEIYVSGRFDDRWRKERIERI